MNISMPTVWRIRKTLEAFNTVKSSALGNREVYICHTRLTTYSVSESCMDKK